MKCPYAVNTKIITQIGFAHDDSGLPVTQTAVESQESDFLDCVKEDCAVWRDGCCQYNGKA